MIEILATCDACGLQHFFGVRLDEPLPPDELRARIVEKLGSDGAFICVRCQSLVFVQVGEEPIADAGRLKRAEAARRIGRATRGVRFGVGDPCGARSSVWRVWMNNRRDDVYISARGLASELKVSLHPEFWYFGFTSNHARKSDSSLPPGVDRKRHVWDRPEEFGVGWTRAFEIIVPASEVVEAPVAYEGSEAVWLPTPEMNEAMHFSILLSKPGAARGRRGYPSAEGAELSTEFVTRLSMATGEELWVLAHAAPMPDSEIQRLERARQSLNDYAHEILLERATQDPTFSARAIAFADSEDGVASFTDVSLAHVPGVG